MSPIAYALFTNLRDRPDGANVVLEELVEALHSSKTAIRAAFAELAESGLLSYTQVT
jgi:DNA-binding GntR family transcriptional regulator